MGRSGSALPAPAAFFTSPEPGVLERQEKPGFLTFFGLPFLLSGLLVAQAPLGLLTIRFEGEAFGFIPALLFALPFILIGAVLVFGRWGLRLDMARREAVAWIDVIVPLRRHVFRFEELRAVLLRKDSSGDGPTTYPVRLAGIGGDEMAVHAPSDYPEARCMAEFLARLLKLPMRDDTTGVLVERPSDRLDESYRDRLRRLGGLPPLPNQPPGLADRLRLGPGGFELTVAPVDRGSMRFIPAALAAAFAVYVGLSLLLPLWTSPTPTGVRLLFSAFLLVFFMAAPLAASLRWTFGTARMPTRVLLTAGELLVEGPGGRMVMPLAEIEELVLPAHRSVLEKLEGLGQGRMRVDSSGAILLSDGRPTLRWLSLLVRHHLTQGIIAISDKTVVTFGAGMPEEELEYLHALLSKTIAR